MSPATNTKHASPSGAELFPENRIPPAEGNPTDPMFPISPELVADALAVYQGKPPSREWGVRTAYGKNLVARLGRTSLPELTPSLLELLHPDIHGQDYDEEYNSRNVLERAIRDLLSDLVDDLRDFQLVENPRYRAELHAAQRRTLA